MSNRPHHTRAKHHSPYNRVFRVFIKNFDFFLDTLNVPVEIIHIGEASWLRAPRLITLERRLALEHVELQVFLQHRVVRNGIIFGRWGAAGAVSGRFHPHGLSGLFQPPRALKATADTAAAGDFIITFDFNFYTIATGSSQAFGGFGDNALAWSQAFLVVCVPAMHGVVTLKKVAKQWLAEYQRVDASGPTGLTGVQMIRDR